MSDFGQRVFTPAQVRDIDRAAIEKLGIPAYTLMTRAGEATFRAARARFPSARRWRVYCGAGNNAGDGYVVARLAREAGVAVDVVTLTDPGGLQGDAARAWRDYAAAGGEAAPVAGGDAADLIVDAVFGTGLSRPVEGPQRAAIEAINASGARVVAVDVPSGLDALRGTVLGAAVRADLTVTFIGRKLGLYVGHGPDLAGEVVYAGLDVPASRVFGVTEAARLFGAGDLPSLLPRRPRTGQKGQFGHVLVVGGNHGMAGAARLAGEAALRAGAGLVSVATRPGNESTINAARAELMCRGVGSAADLAPLLERASLVAIGPGLGQDDWARARLAEVMSSGRPLVVDADALNLLAGRLTRRSDWILTPHPGEAARLLGTSTAAVQADRPAAAGELAAQAGGVVLLKGRCTLVAAAGVPLEIIDRGNPGMASGGMGDVLTGVIAGLRAQFPAADPQRLTAAAAFIHAAAGDAAALPGERGLIASDVLAQLRPWLNPSP
jgi:hydroxyethylthiazole kinase-like uncharacterized protein yjeF